MEIVRPTLLVDESKCKANIRRIADKARRSGVVLRPHFKTHQSHEIGGWFRDAGVTCCTVSSVKMASYFAADGWKDITVAFPLNFLEWEEINRLAETITLNVLLVSTEAPRELLKKLKNPVNCFIEVDTGYHRTGVEPSQNQLIEEIISVISGDERTKFKGFLTHAGQSYQCRSGPEILKVHQMTCGLMKKLGDKFRKNFPDLVLSVGDTPTCSMASDFDGINEMRPGNFVFYDLMQYVIGACSKENISVAMACPVVAVHPTRNEVVVHGGGVHFSKDLLRSDDGGNLFGEAVKLNGSGWELLGTPLRVKSLSQEHGILYGENVQQYKEGDVIGILPIHSCMTADVMGEYMTTTGRKISMMDKR